MHTPEPEAAWGEPVSERASESADERPGVGEAAKRISQHASALARLELELATFELRRKAAAFGRGAGFGLGALVLLLFMLGFGLATIAAVLDTFLARWLSLLIVTGGLLAVTGLLGLLALRAIKRGSPPVPEQAIDEAKLTTEALKRNGTTG